MLCQLRRAPLVDEVFPAQPVLFRWVAEPTGAEFARLVQIMARRIGRFLDRQGVLVRDPENSFRTGNALAAKPMAQFPGSSVTSRIAFGA